MTLKKSILNKLVFTLAVAALLYVVGETWGITPQPMKDSVTFFGEHFESILWLIGLVVVCYVVLRILNRQKGKPGAK